MIRSSVGQVELIFRPSPNPKDPDIIHRGRVVEQFARLVRMLAATRADPVRSIELGKTWMNPAKLPRSTRFKFELVQCFCCFSFSSCTFEARIERVSGLTSSSVDID